MAEKRLIDANALRAVLKNEECNCEVFPWALDNAPTVDAVEVVHGRWITPVITPWCFKCSECRTHHDSASNYCPNCGAKMDGGDENAGI